jgi:hypothetical protein
MTRPTSGCCGTCGWLAKRARPPAPGNSREHSGVFEVEMDQRDHPRQFFHFIPGESNAAKLGELTCFRHAADLQEEMRVAGGPRQWQPIQTDEFAKASAGAADAVIWKDRNCPRWSKYEIGISPREHLAEQKARCLEVDRQEFLQSLADHEAHQVQRERRADRRLTAAAVILACIIGMAQLLAAFVTMAPDSVGYRWLHGSWPTVFSLSQQSESDKVSQTYRAVMPDGNTYEVNGPKGASDEAVKAEVARQQPAAAIPAQIHLPRAPSVGEFMQNYGPQDKPIAIAPPCNGNKPTCDPGDRMWDKFPGTLEAGTIITPNGLIYRGKSK